jgi:8-oxo-dGTP pyrophosphatase MutT (NUDIX family)
MRLYYCSMTGFNILREQLRSRLAGAEESLPIGADVRQAAVALVLREHDGEAELLMIKRAVRAGDHWSGNLALPGGRWQAEDSNLLATAVRETHEEIGMDLASGGEVLGRLDTIKTRNPLVPRIDVTPFVFVAPSPFHLIGPKSRPQPLTPNHEVAAAFWVSVDFLKANGPSEVHELIIEGGSRVWPAYPSEHGPIWGMTERMLTDFLALIVASE